MPTAPIPESCLAFFEILAEALGDLSQCASMPKSATHRMLASLVDGDRLV